MSTRKLRPPATPSGNEPAGPGRVVFDSRGNPVWEWNTESGDSTSVLLKQLENDDLALEPTRSFRSINQRTAAPPQGRPAPARKRHAAQSEPLELEERKAGKGFDPYNRS